MLFLVGLPFKSRTQVTFWLVLWCRTHFKTHTHTHPHTHRHTHTQVFLCEYLHITVIQLAVCKVSLVNHRELYLTQAVFQAIQFEYFVEVWFLRCLELQLKTQCLLFGESQFNFRLHVTILRNHGCERAYGNYLVLLLLQQQSVDIHSQIELSHVIWSQHYQRY